MSSNHKPVEKSKPAYVGKPWEQQPTETPKPYEAFLIYLHMGVDRSIKKVAEQLDKNESLIYRWSGDYHWVDRCTYFDQERNALLMAEEKRIHLQKIENFLKTEDVVSNKCFFMADSLFNTVIEEIKSLKDTGIPLDKLVQYTKLGISLAQLGNSMKLEALGINKLYKKYKMEKESQKENPPDQTTKQQDQDDEDDYYNNTEPSKDDTDEDEE